jgi:hypothetical protein
VLDSRDSPITEASVSLNCGGCTTQTGQEGRFVFPNLKPGNYTLTVLAKGFYQETLPYYVVEKKQDWTYFPIQLKRCPFGGCGLWPRRKQIFHCE